MLIEIAQPDPEKVHLNCDIHFGADGYLWAGFGDGVDDDELSEAQNLGNLNGKILRIDVDERGPTATPYAIPADNPFVGRAGARGEIWALGLPQPLALALRSHRPGVIWAGEIGLLAPRGGQPGGQGRQLRLEHHRGHPVPWTSPATPPGSPPPWSNTQHREGRSVTGRPVYRGQKLPGLRDRYVYADFISGAVWALPADRSPRPETILETGLRLVSFGEALDEELYLLDYDGGRLHHVAPAAPAATRALPPLLSRDRLPGAARRRRGRLVPYDVNSPLFSDGASKRRWMALPPGGQDRHRRGRATSSFPPGSTLVKEFSVGATRVETRLFVRHGDGVWAGYSYAWNAEQTDATLVPPSSVEVKRTVGGVTWSHPTRWHCMACHTPGAGFALGPEIAQLNRAFAYPDGTRNQLAHLAAAPACWPRPCPRPRGAARPAVAHRHDPRWRPGPIVPARQLRRLPPAQGRLRHADRLPLHHPAGRDAGLRPRCHLHQLRGGGQAHRPRRSRGLGADPVPAQHGGDPHAPGGYHPRGRARRDPAGELDPRPRRLRMRC